MKQFLCALIIIGLIISWIILIFILITQFIIPIANYLSSIHIYSFYNF